MKTIRWTVAGALVLVLLGFASGCRPKANGPAPATIEAVNRGVSLMGQYDYDGATRAFEEALAASPDLPEVQVNLAIARFNRGKKENQDVEQASQLLEAVLKKDPQHVRALYFKGIVLQHQGQADAAIPCFEKVLQQHPEDGVAWYILGMCKQRLGQDAEKELRRAIELRPYLVSAYYRLWQTLQAAGQTERAAPFLEAFKRLRESALAETIELPQYNQMGDLALVVPLGGTPSPARAPAGYRAGEPNVVAVPASTSAEVQAWPHWFAGAALADTNRDGQFEVFLTGWLPRSFGPEVVLKANAAGAGFTPGTAEAGLKEVDGALTAAIGDFDNDENADLFLVTRRGNSLFRGTKEGRFLPVQGALPALPGEATTRSALWLDADHDGDLDLFLCNTGGPNQLFNNNSDGTFASVPLPSELAAPEGDSVLVLPGDLDGDRDMDLVLVRAGAPARLFRNELAGRFTEAPLEGVEVRGELGSALQDFDGDGHLDLLALGGTPAELKLFRGDGHAHLRPAELWADGEKPVAGSGVWRGLRIADADLDGDLDVAVFAEREGHLLLNDRGRFRLQSQVWAAGAGRSIRGAELVDLTNDLIPDLLLLEGGAEPQVRLIPGRLSSTSTAVSLAPTGVRSRDKRTRSPASGYGVAVTVRAGLREQSRYNSGQSGGLNQSPAPLVFGLGAAPRADYARLLWPDGVAQVETALAAGQRISVAETQRKISSCPLLFTWNGSRFEFITDFAGVGGLGYYVGLGEYAQPQPVDHVKIEPHQLRERKGRYELRITEAMEETAYMDRVELRAIDHPEDWVVFPDERLAVSGPSPTRELLAVEKPIFARRAVNPAGLDCADALRQVDRRYAFEPELDRRFFGFCRPHALELAFGDQLTTVRPDERVFLFITGYLEYPYSQTTYAAGQARVGWEPIRIDRRRPDGTWETVVPDAGALSGMSRTMTVELTGLVNGPDCTLRLSSNLEIYYDQIFLGVPVRSERVQVHTLPVAEAELRYGGFAQEVSPDGRHPLIYDYQQSEPTAPFAVLSGAYTRYGPVRELLQDYDDQFVLVAPGDEIAVEFDATGLPKVRPGTTRSFVLVSHAYCKDMDLYTATPQTLDPMPFRGMKRYPYAASERPAETEDQKRTRATYNTRLVE